MDTLFDLLIPVLIILGIAWAALRSFMDRGKGEPVRVNALRPGAFVAERNSSAPATREEAVSPDRYTRVSIEQVAEDQAPRRRVPEARRAKASTRASAMRRTLQNPESFRTALILRELLGPPVGLGKDEHPLDQT